LLREAYRAYVQERYPTAVHFFRRFLDDFPDAPRAPEVRWWLGRSLEQAGDLQAAIEQYRLLAIQQPNAAGQVYGSHANHRLDELSQGRGGAVDGVIPKVALQVGVEHLPFPAVQEEWLKALTRAGIASLVVDAIVAADAGLEARRKQEWASLVSEAHRVGLQMWIALDVHRGSGFQLRPDWRSLTVASDGGDAFGAPPDVTHPEYQLYLEELVGSLASSGFDGIFLRARQTSGYGDEYSHESFRIFAESFGLSLSPQDVFRVGQAVGPGTQERPPEYWRWVGWKAARYAGFTWRLRRMLRRVNPAAVVLVEIHGGAVDSPARALEQYGEDVAELVRSGVALAVQRDTWGSDALLERVAQQVRTADRVWITRSVALPSPSEDAFRGMLVELRTSARWNVVVNLQGPLPLP
jgi:hypothetical protein